MACGPAGWPSAIVAYERPRRIVDEQVEGPCAAWRHEHRFEDDPAGARVTEVVDSRSPLGAIGRLVDRVRLERYLTDLLRTRNAFLRDLAEGR